jgi:glycosyltransferase involved in cell wall biosynthesis
MRVTAVTTGVIDPRKPRLLSFARALRLAGHEVGIVATTDLSTGGGGSASADALAQLARLGVSVTYVSFDPSPAHLARAAARVAFRRSSSETALYDSASLASRFAAAVDATRPDVLHVDRVRALSLTRGLTVPLVVDITDPRLAAYDHYRRGGRPRPLRVGLPETLRAWFDRRPAVLEETRAVRGVPLLVAAPIGREMLIRAGADPKLVSNVPNAVFPDERVAPRRPLQNGPAVLGMSGNFSYPPNILGFETLAKEILPHLRQAIDARIVVIGSSPHRLVLRTARKAGVEVHADVTSVSAAIRELGVSVMLSPQTVSAGFPNRVIDAVYRAGVPIVASRETVAGMPEALALAMPVATTPRAWAQQTSSLLTGETSQDLVVDLQERIDGICGPDRVAGVLTTAYRSAMSSPPSPLRTAAW